MKLNSNQALERLMYGTGMRKANGEAPRLLDRVKTYKKDRLFVFGRGETAIVAVTADNRELCQKCAEYAVIHPFGTINVENL